MSAPTPDPPPPPGDANNNPQPTSPRSPRSAPAPATIAIGQPLPPELLQPQPPPRPNITSMLFLTAFFFFMSGNNHPINSGIEIGPDGELRARVSELDHAKMIRDEWEGVLHGNDTMRGNYTESAVPLDLPASLIPPEYTYNPSHHDFFTNITGFFRSSTLHPISLEPNNTAHLPQDGYWQHLSSQIPDLGLNTTGKWNATLADELRGSWKWDQSTKWNMNLKERNISSIVPDLEDVYRANGTEWERYEDWNWIKGSLTLTAQTPPTILNLTEVDGLANTETSLESGETTISYDFFGLHYLPNGTYNLYGSPEGMRIDIRKIPGLWYGQAHQNVTKEIILRELEKEVRNIDGNLMIGDLRDDDISEQTTCPLLIHLTLPPIPPGITKEEIDFYNAEVQNPTGIKASIPRPPAYWEVGKGLGGVIIADQCGWAMGIEGGEGIGIDEFWGRSIDYAAYATISQLIVLLLLVRQMEQTRTPSSLSKVSVYTIVIMSITDSWIFSAHVVVGIMSDNKASLPMLVPGFMCLCTAVVFGPRYAVLLHRIQAPERVSAPTPTITRNTNNQPAVGPATNAGNAGASSGVEVAEDGTVRRISFLDSLKHFFSEHPLFRWFAILGFLFCFLQFAFLPSVIPFFLFGLYSFWLPQIWRNARRGTSRAMDAWIVIGTTLGRLALPLYAFAYSENVFFIEKASWIWGIVWWQLAQVTVLFAQERFGPSFFLPKSLSPPESYNYHPVLPSFSSDPEAAASFPLLSTDEKTCSICMEEVDLSQSLNQNHSHSTGGLGNKRKNYALAPCGHLFHTNCLSQWMAVKTICPLCKRSLPPL
ncbi:uncharacterized protein I303_108108 [Kwoniella dejecticola CBS 10117]|uniref:RING-type E3 ubiquitin transferase n=1 Tax=Kwoniella dejecticola CBS 10117 TaxID=1296121 RepID=A0A1A5ZWJ7_9TREE|nr:uncharacterized protein I303_08099 [Kwoniella dejecticola CBS 10117]OBR82185.1 hypothetical protein I303_08099 [Kwoniella dejecticola CBS 10117]